MGGIGILKALGLCACMAVLAACEIVDTGASRFGAASCTASSATAGTPEYRDCRRAHAAEPRRSDRTPGGGIN